MTRMRRRAPALATPEGLLAWLDVAVGFLDASVPAAAAAAAAAAVRCCMESLTLLLAVLPVEATAEVVGLTPSDFSAVAFSA